MQAPSADLPPIERLRAIMHCLRAPGGCPWDRKQTLLDAALFEPVPMGVVSKYFNLNLLTFLNNCLRRSNVTFSPIQLVQ